jgi:hypothetical protein
MLYNISFRYSLFNIDSHISNCSPMIDIGNKFAVAMLSMTTRTNFSLVSMTFKMAVTPVTPYKSCDTVPVN